MLVVVFSPSLFAADNASATRMIASVLVDLNHFPSESEKTGLLALAEDEGVGRAFRAVASSSVTRLDPMRSYLLRFCWNSIIWRTKKLNPACKICSRPFLKTPGIPECLLTLQIHRYISVALPHRLNRPANT